jgi:para-nitrobenzyl esterase
VKGESYKPYSLLMEQIWFNVPVLTMSENQTKGGGKSYTYFLTRTQHGIELPVVFNHPEMNDEPFDETFSKTMRRLWVQFAKTGNPSLSADASPDGKAKEWPLYDSENKQVMVLDEYDIHPEKESGLKIVDWERTYFLTKYYCF